MTIQLELNGACADVYKLYKKSWKSRLVMGIFVLALIGFSIYGWLCTLNIIKSNLPFCSESLGIALILEIIFGIFWIIPMFLWIILNCIYPLQSEVPNPPKTPMPDHAYISFNNLYTIKE